MGALSYSVSNFARMAESARGKPSDALLSAGYFRLAPETKGIGQTGGEVNCGARPIPGSKGSILSLNRGALAHHLAKGVRRVNADDAQLSGVEPELLQRAA